jgi:hypothetical protein
MNSSKDVVHLDVGGRKFKTLRSTLLSIEGTYFSGLLECDSSDGEYFIDRNPDKFEPILEYFRNKGNSSDFIDPIEAAFFALPLPSINFHQVLQKEISVVREFFVKYQHEILDDLILYFSGKRGAIYEDNSVGWLLFGGSEWSQNTLQQLKQQQQNSKGGPTYTKSGFKFEGYQAELMSTFLPDNKSLFRTLLSQVELFFLPQGLKCSFRGSVTSRRTQWSVHFSWKLPSKIVAIEEEVKKELPLGDSFQVKHKPQSLNRV